MVGTKWYKCDLHLHTPASKCFEDKSVTPAQWVKEAKEKGLECIAVTDHNSAEWVELIQEEANKVGLIVFPGVELTCSDAKVHLLVLFEIGTNKTEIEDFMLICSIKRADFGKTEAHSGFSVEEVLTEVQKKNAICIPAHIDDFSGISEVANTLREKIFKSELFLGVQVVHIDLTKDDKEYNKTEALNSINRLFGVSEEDLLLEKYKVSEIQLKGWRSPIQQAKKYSKAILTFSDNPDSIEIPNKHGLWGIGNTYSWIKMDQSPSLESLRQAMLLHKFRIKNSFISREQPYKTPDTWIQSISIKETELSPKGQNIIVEFNPQMNTIIGGRGSGKSSILQFIRGIFQKENELDSLINIKNDFNNFFKIKDRRRQGVLKVATVIEIIVNRRDEFYKVIFNQINPTKQERKIFKYNELSSLFDLEQDLSFLSILDFDIFSQKQIYEIANNLNSLRERIDESSSNITDQQSLIRHKRAEYIKKSAAISELKVKIEKKAILKSEILDIKNKIDTVKEIGIESELKRIQEFDADNLKFKSLVDSIDIEKSKFEILIQTIRDLKLQSELFTIANLPNLETPINNINSILESIAIRIENAKEEFGKLTVSVQNELSESQWKIDKSETEELFRQKKQALLEQGIARIEELEDDIKKLALKKGELEIIERIEGDIKKSEVELSKLKVEYTNERMKLTTSRKAFLESLLTDGKVRAKVQNCEDFEHLEEQIRLAMGSPDSFEKDISTLIDYWTAKDVKRANKGVFDIISGIQNGTKAGADFDKRFLSKIKTLNGEQINSFDLMFPEDIIQLEYFTNSGEWKTLSNASAGQKTAAILTLIMSEGNKPLILDQPEDDLDNYLIYDLVVDQLRKSKETRQIIAVTHNANIPVNGDSEVIIVMDSETKHLSPKFIGTIEEYKIKNAVCSIMEGGTDAFEMRSKRYQNLQRQ
jgi:energy-coupling factor transporter ATP-binding protein EcfA2